MNVDAQDVASLVWEVLHLITCKAGGNNRASVLSGTRKAFAGQVNLMYVLLNLGHRKSAQERALAGKVGVEFCTRQP